jgi:hypothetical protein
MPFIGPGRQWRGGEVATGGEVELHCIQNTSFKEGK